LASPTNAGRTNTNGSSAAINKVVNYVASIGAGNLLIMVLRSAGADTHTTPTDWSDLVKNSSADASDDTTSIFYKQAVGTESGTITVTCTTSLKFAAVMLRITGHENPSTQPPEISTIATGTSATVDPTTVTPTGGSKDYLFVWVGAWEGEQNAGAGPAGGVTNYTNKISGVTGASGGSSGNCQVTSLSRQLTAASEDPGSLDIVTADDWSAWTIAVHPPGAAPSFTFFENRHPIGWGMKPQTAAGMGGVLIG